jgi:hypothetical protein
MQIARAAAESDQRNCCLQLVFVILLATCNFYYNERTCTETNNRSKPTSTDAKFNFYIRLLLSNLTTLNR